MFGGKLLTLLAFTLNLGATASLDSTDEGRLLKQMRTLASCRLDGTLVEANDLPKLLDLPPRQITVLAPLMQAGPDALVTFWAEMGTARAFSDLFVDPADFWVADESLRQIYRRVMRRHHVLRTLKLSSSTLRQKLGHLRRR